MFVEALEGVVAKAIFHPLGEQDASQLAVDITDLIDLLINCSSHPSSTCVNKRVPAYSVHLRADVISLLGGLEELSALAQTSYEIIGHTVH